MDKKIKEKFVNEYKGRDKIKGRPIRLNRQILEVRKKNYTEVIFIGDIHYGYPTANLEKVKTMIDYALEKNIYVLLMGDMVEAGILGSVGDSWWSQKLNPQLQLEGIVNLFKSLADKKLILGLHKGNHEDRITKITGIDIAKIMAKLLNVPYLSYSCWNLFTVGKQKYSIYSTHGVSGSILEHTKLNAVVKLSKITSADVVVMGHTHGLASDIVMRQYYCSQKDRIEEVKQYVILSGSYIEYDTSYGQMKNYPIPKIGSPKVKLFTDEKDVHFSI